MAVSDTEWGAQGSAREDEGKDNCQGQVPRAWRREDG